MQVLVLVIVMVMVIAVVIVIVKAKAYMQKTCDVAEKAILAKKIAEKVRKSRQNVNRDKSA